MSFQTFFFAVLESRLLTGIFRCRQTFCTAKSPETTVPPEARAKAMTEMSVSDNTRRSPDFSAADFTAAVSAGPAPPIFSPSALSTSKRIFETWSRISSATSAVVQRSPSKRFSAKKRKHPEYTACLFSDCVSDDSGCRELGGCTLDGVGVCNVCKSALHELDVSAGGKYSVNTCCTNGFCSLLH